MKQHFYLRFLCISLAAAALWQLRPGAAIYEKLSATFEVTPTQQTAETASPQEAVEPESEPANELHPATSAAPMQLDMTEQQSVQTLPSADAEPDLDLESDSDFDSAPDLDSDAGSDANAAFPIPPAEFADTLFIGDSRTVGLSEYGDLGKADVFAGTGLTVFQLFKEQVKVKQFGQTSLENLLTQKQYQLIYLMLGINEIGYPESQLLKQYRSTVETLQKLQPNATLVLCANLHVTAEKSAASTIYNNTRINALNTAIQELAAELHCSYIDANVLFDDENGNLSKDDSSDGSHPLGRYYARWSQWLQTGTV